MANPDPISEGPNPSDETSFVIFRHDISHLMVAYAISTIAVGHCGGDPFFLCLDLH